MNRLFKNVIGAGAACLFLFLTGSCLEQNPQVTLPETAGSSSESGDNDDVEAAINEITEEKIGVHVTLKPVVYSAFPRKCPWSWPEMKKWIW